MNACIVLVTFMASALSDRSNPFFAIDADRFLALPTGSVVYRIGRVAAAGVVVGEVGLRLVAFSDTTFVVEVIDLPLLALTKDWTALKEGRVPLGFVLAFGYLAYPGYVVEDGFFFEA